MDKAANNSENAIILFIIHKSTDQMSGFRIYLPNKGIISPYNLNYSEMHIKYYCLKFILYKFTIFALFVKYKLQIL